MLRIESCSGLCSKKGRTGPVLADGDPVRVVSSKGRGSLRTRGTVWPAE